MKKRKNEKKNNTSNDKNTKTKKSKNSKQEKKVMEHAKFTSRFIDLERKAVHSDTIMEFFTKKMNELDGWKKKKKKKLHKKK